jgi:hypothetical protein
MLAEDLIVLAAAKGIDLKRIAGGSTPDSGPSVRRRRRGGDELKRDNGRPIYESVKGHQTRVVRYPAWSHAELGQAAGGVPRLPWLAAQFSLAGDRTPDTFWELYEGLLGEALLFRRQHQWPHQVVGIGGAARFYLPELAQLVLDEDQHRPYFEAQSRLYPIYLHVEPHVWNGKLYERFDRLKCVYQAWLGTALGMIQRKVSEREAVSEAV